MKAEGERTVEKDEKLGTVGGQVDKGEWAGQTED